VQVHWTRKEELLDILQEKADRFQLEKERERERERKKKREKKAPVGKKTRQEKNNPKQKQKKSFRNDISLSFWFDFCSVGWWWWRLLEQRSGMP